MTASEIEIIVTTIMRPYGETGVQTHFNCFRDFLTSRQQKQQLITPFSSPKYLVYPVFALRKIVDRLSGPLSVWWYRYWHAYFLKLALQQYLKAGQPCVIYAQCPLSALSYHLKCRQSAHKTLYASAEICRPGRPLQAV